MRKFLLKLLMGASLTTSVFLFQACYGVPVDEVYDVPRNQVEVKSDEANAPEAPDPGLETAGEETESETLALD